MWIYVVTGIPPYEHKTYVLGVYRSAEKAIAEQEIFEAHNYYDVEIERIYLE